MCYDEDQTDIGPGCVWSPGQTSHDRPRRFMTPHPHRWILGYPLLLKPFIKTLKPSKYFSKIHRAFWTENVEINLSLSWNLNGQKSNFLNYFLLFFFRVLSEYSTYSPLWWRLTPGHSGIMIIAETPRAAAAARSENIFMKRIFSSHHHTPGLS